MNLLVTAAFILALLLVAEKIENSLGDSTKKGTSNIPKEDFKNE